MKNRIANYVPFEIEPFIKIHKLFLIAIVYYFLVNSIIVIASNSFQWIYDFLGFWQIFEPIIGGLDLWNISFFYEILNTPFIFIGTFLVSIIPVIIIIWLFVEIVLLIMDEYNIRKEDKLI